MRLSELRYDEGVYNSIKTRRQYDRLVREGFIRTARAYAGRQILYPTLADFRSAHGAIFNEVSGDAGSIRDGGCLVQIFGSSPDECDVEAEFDLLGRQIAEMTSKAKTIQDGVVIVAFTHARIVALQPAVFGNKRAAMCLCLSQIRVLFPIVMRLELFSLNAYYVALEAAISDGQTDRLTQVFGQMLGIPGPFTAARFSVRSGENSKRGQKIRQAARERFWPDGNRLELLIDQ